MCSGLSMTSFNVFETLETKQSCSALVGFTYLAPAHDDDTAPDREDDPGPLPSDKEPIIYPTTKPSGPVGPGSFVKFHL